MVTIQLNVYFTAAMLQDKLTPKEGAKWLCAAELCNMVTYLHKRNYTVLVDVWCLQSPFYPQLAGYLQMISVSVTPCG